MSDISPARVCAYTVVRRVFEQGAYADRALIAEARGLEPRDRALATRLAYGTVQRKGTLDYVVSQFSSRPPERLDPPVLAAVRLGLYQLLYLDGIGAHAAVNEAVELCKRHARGGGQLVNAVLRRATRDGRGLVEALTDDTPQAAAIKYSVPGWLASQWFEELGAERARELMGAINEPAESALRVNTLKAVPAEIAQQLPAGTAGDELPEGLILKAPFDIHGSELFKAGLVMPQSRGSMLVARVLDPRPGERVLDLCAAPGAKTTHLAALMRNEGELVAVERNPKRAQALRRTCEQLGAEVTVVEGDARKPPDGPFDRVLVDPPCSGLGTLQSRPDVRWRANPQSIAELQQLQREILAGARSVLAPGGRLVYSVCTISRAECEDVVGDAESRQLMPDSDRTDGFFIASVRAA
ncbi:MAG TPA: 16S rRNA (cytosine(967)-C(5))-methyltransferase RsmB [Solirubrobacteraceae bacterium]|nr:16S rRNA (cytosine(967)-C(5))-methyltransferase RsmB [Solirubrobacteraceae bacterium]